MHWYFMPFIYPSMACNVPVLFAEKQSRIMMLPAPYFTVGVVFSGSYAHPFFLQKSSSSRRVPSFCQSSIFVSSFVLMCVKCSWANCGCTSLCSFFSRGLLCKVKGQRVLSCSISLIVLFNLCSYCVQLVLHLISSNCWLLSYLCYY